MLDLPAQTIYNRRIPKSKFYQKLAAGSKLKELFVTQVDSIVWKHKLSRETTNLEPTEEVREIQVFEIVLKQKELSKDVLTNIDKAVMVLKYNCGHKNVESGKLKARTDEIKSRHCRRWSRLWQWKKCGDSKKNSLERK